MTRLFFYFYIFAAIVMTFSFIMIAGIETCICVAVFQKFISRERKTYFCVFDIS